jgi:Putative peptidoglycan binding domain
MVAPGNMSRGMPTASRNFDGRRFDDFRFRDHDFDDRFRFRNVFVFNGGFGFPFWGWGYPYGYPYYGYPYYGGGYYGYAPGYSGYYSGGGYGYGGQGSQSQVAQLQRQLKAAGYYHGSIDGIMGPRTRSALRASERDRGMAQNQQPAPPSY